MGPFAFCVIGFTIILISGLLFELTDLIFVKSVPVETVGRMLLYKLPDMVVLTLPIAVLFATLVSLGRLVQDSEMKVLRVSGLSFPRLILPVVILGFVVSGVTYWASEEVVPEANHKYENTLRRIIFSEGIPLIEENVFFYGGENRYFYISEVDNERRELYNILVYELGNGPFPRLITAKRGSFVDNIWVLNDGIVQELDDEGFVSHETRFGQMEIVTDQKADVFLGNQRTTTEMNRKELKQHIERFQRSGLKVLSFVWISHEAGPSHVIVYFASLRHLRPCTAGRTLLRCGCEPSGDPAVLCGMSVARSWGKWGFAAHCCCVVDQRTVCPGRGGPDFPRGPAKVMLKKGPTLMRRTGLILAMVLILVCGSALNGSAAEEVSIRISAARSGWYDAVQKLFVGEGDVQIATEDTLITGDYVEWSIDTGELVVSGNVVLKQGENELAGEYLFYSVNRGEGEFLDVSASLRRPRRRAPSFCALRQW